MNIAAFLTVIGASCAAFIMCTAPALDTADSAQLKRTILIIDSVLFLIGATCFAFAAGLAGK